MCGSATRAAIRAAIVSLVTVLAIGCAPNSDGALGRTARGHVPAWLDARTHPLVWVRADASLCAMPQPKVSRVVCPVIPTQKVRIRVTRSDKSGSGAAQVDLSSHRTGWVNAKDLVAIVPGHPIVDCELNPNGNVDYVDFVDESDALEPALELRPPVRAQLLRQESATIYDLHILSNEHNGASARGFSLDGCSIELPDGTSVDARLAF